MNRSGTGLSKEILGRSGALTHSREWPNIVWFCFFLFFPIDQCFEVFVSALCMTNNWARVTQAGYIDYSNVLHRLSSLRLDSVSFLCAWIALQLTLREFKLGPGWPLKVEVATVEGSWLLDWSPEKKSTKSITYKKQLAAKNVDIVRVRLVWCDASSATRLINSLPRPGKHKNSSKLHT